jgi:purine-nucleoside phosphorylase
MRYEEVEEAGRSLLDSIPGAPTTALVLGSGLAGLRRLLPSSEVVEYGDIPYFPRTTVGGHEGRIHAGVVGGTNVLILSGRVHYYERRRIDQPRVQARRTDADSRPHQPDGGESLEGSE